MSDFHRASPKMAWLRLCRIANKSAETKKLLLKFKQRVALAVELSIVKLRCTGVQYFLIFALKHRLWVLVRTASLRRL